MRISELARASGLPVATIKFYLRERLLPEGQLTSATRAQYGEEHLARLSLVRALLGTGRLSVAAARDVLAQLDSPPDSVHDVLGAAHDAVTPAEPPGVDLSAADALLERWGWWIDEQNRPARAALAQALAALDQAGFELPPGALDLQAATMHELADFELAHVPTSSLTDALRYVVLGTVLVEPILLALRRLAEADASARRFGGTRTGAPQA